MKKELARIYADIEKITLQLDGLKDTLKEKMEAIEDRAAEYDRDLTEKESERYAALEDQANDIEEAFDNLHEALNLIENYL